MENSFSKHPEIDSVNVYGIPMNHHGYDGQLGCAAVTFRGNTSPHQPSDSQREVVQRLESWLLTSDGALPAYTVPRFLRVLVESEDAPRPDQIGMGGDTGQERVSMIMKKLKTGLRKEGQSQLFVFREKRFANPGVVGFSIPPGCKDRMYWIENEGSGYVPFTKEAEQLILSGKARL